MTSTKQKPGVERFEFSLAEVERLNKEVPELWGATQVAKRLGVLQSNLYQVARLPAPAQKAGAGNLWRRDVIERFAKAREGRRRG